jgi:hypothetical protein
MYLFNFFPTDSTIVSIACLMASGSVSQALMIFCKFGSLEQVDNSSFTSGVNACVNTGGTGLVLRADLFKDKVSGDGGSNPPRDVLSRFPPDDTPRKSKHNNMILLALELDQLHTPSY